MTRIDIYYPFIRILLLKIYLLNNKIFKVLSKYKIVDKSFSKLPDITKYTQIYIINLPIHKVLLLRLITGARIDIFYKNFGKFKFFKKIFKVLSINIHIIKNSSLNLPNDFRKYETFVPEIIIISNRNSITIKSFIEKISF